MAVPVLSLVEIGVLAGTQSDGPDVELPCIGGELFCSSGLTFSSSLTFRLVYPHGKYDRSLVHSITLPGTTLQSFPLVINTGVSLSSGGKSLAQCLLSYCFISFSL